MKLPYKPKIAVYTHDTFGLGHVRRCLHIIKQLSRDLPESAILLVTGCPATQFLQENLPQNVDFIKIPTMVKTGSSGSTPPHLPLGLPEMTSIRARIIRESITAFSPDVFLVDNFPLGAQSELLPTLEALSETKTRCILGLRDILDSGEAVRQQWTRQGVYEILDRYYDKILIYGMRDIFDAVQAYAIPDPIAEKVHFCGYLTATAPMEKSPEQMKQELGIEGKMVIATGGGGGDAYPLLSAYMEAAQNLKGVTSLIFAGPLMGGEDKKALKEKAAQIPSIRFQDFVSNLPAYMKAADLVVTMCGYNIAAEIVHHGVNAIVAPRTWRFGEHLNRKKTTEEKEQILRARALKKKGILSLIEPEELNSSSLLEKMEALINRKPPQPEAFNFNGLQTAAAHIHELIG